MNPKKLSKICSNIPKNNPDLTDRNTISQISGQLHALYDEFGYAKVLAELSKTWSTEYALEFFTKNPIMTDKPSEIKHIATYYFRAYSGGIERVQAQLITLWTKMGYKVTLFTDEPENRFDYPYPDSVKRIIIKSSSDIDKRLSDLQQYIKSEKIDIFINHYWTNPSILWECILTKYLNVPYLQFIHGNFAWFFSYGKVSLLTPKIYTLCDLVISLSETNGRFYQLCGCNSYVIQNPIPEDILNIPSNETSDLSSNHILFIGRLSEEKCPLDALEIFKLIHERISNTVLDIIGRDEGNYEKQIIKFSKENHLEDSIFYHGMMHQTEISELYKNASALLFTSRMEGYPMVLLESKAYGIPVVMYELPYLTLTQDGKGILFAPFKDINGMAENMISLLTDKDMLRSYGCASRESFESFKKYDHKSVWEEIFSLCSSESMQCVSGNYFDPGCIAQYDRYIEPLLLQMIGQGYNTEFSYVKKDLALGRFILFIPRKLYRLIRSRIGNFIYGK